MAEINSVTGAKAGRERLEGKRGLGDLVQQHLHLLLEDFYLLVG